MAYYRSGVEIPMAGREADDATTYDRLLTSLRGIDIADDTSNYDLQNTINSTLFNPQPSAIGGPGVTRPPVQQGTSPVRQVTSSSQIAPQSTTVNAQGIQVRMPDGSMKVFPNDSPFLQQALGQGGQALNPKTGQAMKVTPFPGGGFLFDGQPFNFWTTGQYLPGQQQALARGFYDPNGGAATNPGGVRPGNLTPGAPGSLGGGTSQLPGFTDENGNTFDGPNQINQIQLPDAPFINPYFMDAAQIDLNQIPYLQNSDQLNFLLSGQGYSPDILSKMNAGAIDANSRAAAANRSSAKIAGQQAGFGNSPATQAVEAQINRQAGDERTRALNALAIQNANVGMENMRQGVPLAQQLALENASRLFAGMQTNVQNSQQANQLNAGSGNQANYANAQNQINQGLNQAQLNRQGDIYNSNIRENRYGQAFGAAQALIGNQNPYGYNQTGANIGANYTPNLGYANLLQNAANPNGVRTT